MRDEREKMESLRREFKNFKNDLGSAAWGVKEIARESAAKTYSAVRGLAHYTKKGASYVFSYSPLGELLMAGGTGMAVELGGALKEAGFVAILAGGIETAWHRATGAAPGDDTLPYLRIAMGLYGANYGVAGILFNNSEFIAIGIGSMLVGTFTADGMNKVIENSRREKLALT